MAPPNFSALHYLGAPQLTRKPKFCQILNLKNHEIEEQYMCSQWSDKFWMWSACNREKRKSTEFSKTSLEKFVKSNRVNLFLAGFSHLDPLCALTETALQQQWLKMLCFGSNYPRLNLLKKPPDFWHHMGPHSTCLVLEMISSIQVYFPKKVMIERKPVSLLHSVELTFWRVFHKWIWFFTCCPRSWIS